MLLLNYKEYYKSAVYVCFNVNRLIVMLQRRPLVPELLQAAKDGHLPTKSITLLRKTRVDHDRLPFNDLLQVVDAGLNSA